MSISQWSFLDYLVAIIVLVSTGFALTKGLAREVISLVALVGGFFLAVFYYPWTGAWFKDFARSESVADFLGFLLIFAGCITLGAVAAYLVNRFIKMASIQWVDRLLGAVFGFLRGWAIASIVVLALVAFPIREDTVARSRLAPYLLAGARGAVLMVPRELRDRFYIEYQKVLQNLNQSKKEQ